MILNKKKGVIFLTNLLKFLLLFLIFIIFAEY